MTVTKQLRGDILRVIEEAVPLGGTTGQVLEKSSDEDYATAWGSGGGPASVAWGGITGTLSDQTDLDTALALKAPLANPTFTGTVTIPTPFTLGAVSVLPTGTELNFVDGVTSGIQAQLDAKAPIATPTFTGTVTFPDGSTWTVTGPTIASDLTMSSGDQILADDGSATAPGYAFVSAPGKGMWITGGALVFNTAGTIYYQTDNVTRYQLDAGALFPSSGQVITLGQVANGWQELYIQKSTGDAVAPLLNVRKSRGTVSAPTVITTGDDLLDIIAYGYVGATNTWQEAARIKFDSTGTIADTATGIGGIIRFYTATVGGEPTEHLTLMNDGRLYGDALHNNTGAITGTATQYIASGSGFVTTVTTIANIATPTMSTSKFTRVGNVVQMSGQFTADPTLTATASSFEFMLPVASNFAAASDLSGTAVCGNIAGMSAEIIGVAANDTAKVQWVATDITNQTWSWHAQYEVL